MTWHSSLAAPNDGDVPDAADLNEYLDNLEDLRGRAQAKGDYYEYTGADITTTSTTWASISVDFEITVTTDGEDVLVLLVVHCRNMHIDVDVDGTRLGNASTGEGTGMAGNHAGDNEVLVSIPRVVRGLSAGSHTFKGYRKSAGGTGTIYGVRNPRIAVVPL